MGTCVEFWSRNVSPAYLGTMREVFLKTPPGSGTNTVWREPIVLLLIQYISGVPGGGISGFHAVLCCSGLKHNQILQNPCFRHPRRDTYKPPAESARLERTTKYSLGKRLCDPSD